MPRIEHADHEIISVPHDGSITWDQLQAIKNAHWGEDAIAIEVYPAQGSVINKCNMRHIWKVPEGVPVPDLVGGWEK